MLRALAQRARAASLGLKVGTCVAASCDAPRRGTGLRRLFLEAVATCLPNLQFDATCESSPVEVLVPNSCKLVAEWALCLARAHERLRQIRAVRVPSRDGIGRGGERLGRFSDNRLSEILPLCQKANTADVLPPRPFASRPLAANCCGVHCSGPSPATRPRGGVMEGGCLCLDLGEERGIFSRPEPTTGARRPQHPERGHKTLVPAAL